MNRLRLAGATFAAAVVPLAAGCSTTPDEKVESVTPEIVDETTTTQAPPTTVDVLVNPEIPELRGTSVVQCESSNSPVSLDRFGHFSIVNVGDDLVLKVSKTFAGVSENAPQEVRDAISGAFGVGGLVALEKGTEPFELSFHNANVPSPANVVTFRIGVTDDGTVTADFSDSGVSAQVVGQYDMSVGAISVKPGSNQVATRESAFGGAVTETSGTGELIAEGETFRSPEVYGQDGSTFAASVRNSTTKVVCEAAVGPRVTIWDMGL
jgi:hypothetical protein